MSRTTVVRCAECDVSHARGRPIHCHYRSTTSPANVSEFATSEPQTTCLKPLDESFMIEAIEPLTLGTGFAEDLLQYPDRTSMFKFSLTHILDH